MTTEAQPQGRSIDSDEGTVIPLGNSPIVVEAPAPSRPGRLHGIATTSMALCALIGTLAMFALIAVEWPDNLKNVPVVILVISIVGFLASASIAVFSAARDTYARNGARNGRDASPE